MKKIILILFIFSLALGQETSKGLLSFYETVYNFDTIPSNKGLVEHTFKFNNISNDSVKIFIVTASCGCTTPSWSRKPIAPKQEGYIKVAYNPAGRYGNFRKSITVKYRNMRTREEYTTILYIKGYVKPEPKGKGPQFTIQLGNLRFTNNHISLGVVYNNEKAHKGEIIIYNPTDKKITITKITHPKHITFQQKPPITIAPKDTVFLTFYYDATQIKDFGFIYNTVNIFTNEEPGNDKKTIYVSAYLKEYFPPEAILNAPKLTVDKMIHDFGEVKEGEVITAYFTIKNTGKSTLYLRKIKSSCGCTVVMPEKTELKPGEQTRLKVEFRTAGRKGRQHKNITIFSNDPTKSEINLTIKAIVK